MRREISGDVFSAQWKTLLGLRLIQGEVLTFGGGGQNSAAPSLGGVLREASSEAAGPGELLSAGEAGYRGW